MKYKILALVATLLVLSLLPVFTTALDYTDGETQAGLDTGYGVVILKDQPIASYAGGIPGYAKTMPDSGKKLDLNSPAASAYGQYLADQRGSAERWIHSNAPDMQIISEFSGIVVNGFAVKLNGHPIDHLWQVPGVGNVAPEGLYTVEMNRSPTLIGAPAAWSAVGGQSSAGAGMKIGMIDSGVDNTHPFLTDNSLVLPAGFPKCDVADSATGIPDTSCNFVSNKVIVAKVFQTEKTSFDAFAAQPHGTHTSGTAAGVANTCAPLVGCTLSGIAPKAFLGNYNVFPGTVVSTPSRVIAKAVEAAVADGMDVLNLSLGGGARPTDVLANAVNAAADAGVIVAVAAGNSGPGPGTIDSPGIAANVITAGASTNPHFIGVPVTEQNSPGATFGAAVGAGPSFGSPTTAVLLNWDALDGPGDGRACTSLPGTPATGAIVLIRRGICTFSQKDADAAAAGAIGMIVTNSVAGDPVAMGAAFPFTIPGVMVSISNRTPLVNYINAQASMAIVSVNGGTPAEFFSDGAGADILAGFSSIGPPIMQTPGSSSQSGILDKIKPDVTAPGVNVYSSVTSDQCSAPPCFAFFSGTSMATPHVAGSAAVLKQLHPNWSPEQIKSVLVNTAKRPVGSPTSGVPLSNPMTRGGGRIDLAAAIRASATVAGNDNEPSVNFGVFPARSFYRADGITLTSVSSSDITYSITVSEAVSCACVSVSTSSLNVGAGSTGAFTATVGTNPNVLPGTYYGDIIVSGGPVNLVIPYWFALGSPIGGGKSGLNK